jgi:hypothetical protein
MAAASLPTPSADEVEAAAEDTDEDANRDV